MPRERADKPHKARDCVCVMLRFPKDEAARLRRVATAQEMSMAEWVERIVRPILAKRVNSRVFSGEYSSDMWDAINGAKTKDDLKHALYLVCCRVQELEDRVAPSISASERAQ